MRQDDERLKKIRQCIEKIERYSAGGEKDFFANELKQDAILRNFQVIGDAVKDLSKELRTMHPEVPWQAIAGFRDRITHDYFGIKLDLVWEATRDQLQKFKGQIEKIELGLVAPNAPPMKSKLKEELNAPNETNEDGS